MKALPYVLIAVLVVGCGKSRAELSQIVEFEQKQLDQTKAKLTEWEHLLDDGMDAKIAASIAIAKRAGNGENGANLSEQEKLEAPIVSFSYGLKPGYTPDDVTKSVNAAFAARRKRHKEDQSWTRFWDNLIKQETRLYQAKSDLDAVRN